MHLYELNFSLSELSVYVFAHLFWISRHHIFLEFHSTIFTQTVGLKYLEKTCIKIFDGFPNVWLKEPKCIFHGHFNVVQSFQIYSQNHIFSKHEEPTLDVEQLFDYLSTEIPSIQEWQFFLQNLVIVEWWYNCPFDYGATTNISIIIWLELLLKSCPQFLIDSFFVNSLFNKWKKLKKISASYEHVLFLSFIVSLVHLI